MADTYDGRRLYVVDDTKAALFVNGHRETFGVGRHGWLAVDLNDKFVAWLLVEAGVQIHRDVDRRALSTGDMFIIEESEVEARLAALAEMAELHTQADIATNKARDINNRLTRERD